MKRLNESNNNKSDIIMDKNKNKTNKNMTSLLNNRKQLMMKAQEQRRQRRRQNQKKAELLTDHHHHHNKPMDVSPVPKLYTSPRRNKLWKQYNDHRKESSQIQTMLATPSLDHPPKQQQNPHYSYQHEGSGDGHGGIPFQRDSPRNSSKMSIEQTPGETDTSMNTNKHNRSNRIGIDNTRPQQFSHNTGISKERSSTSVQYNLNRSTNTSLQHQNQHHHNHNSQHQEQLHRIKNRINKSSPRRIINGGGNRNWISTAQPSSEWSDADNDRNDDPHTYSHRAGHENNHDTNNHGDGNDDDDDDDTNDRLHRRRTANQLRKNIEARKRGDYTPDSPGLSIQPIIPDNHNSTANKGANGPSTTTTTATHRGDQFQIISRSLGQYEYPGLVIPAQMHDDSYHSMHHSSQPHRRTHSASAESLRNNSTNTYSNRHSRTSSDPYRGISPTRERMTNSSHKKGTGTEANNNAPPVVPNYPHHHPHHSHHSLHAFPNTSKSSSVTSTSNINHYHNNLISNSTSNNTFSNLNTSKDDATINTTITEGSGGARISRYMDTTNATSHETFRNAKHHTHSRYSSHPHSMNGNAVDCETYADDFDDETTVFDANTVNTGDDEQQRNSGSSQQQLQQQPYPLMVPTTRNGKGGAGGYSSLGGAGNSERRIRNAYSSTGDGINHHLDGNTRTSNGGGGVGGGNVKGDPSSSSDDDGTHLTRDEYHDDDDDDDDDNTHEGGSVNSKKSITKRGKKKKDGDINSLLEDPNMKIAAGLTAAAAVGAIVIGPAGLLIGAASLGIVGGYYQIPESQRFKVSNRASSVIVKATDKALKTSDNLSNSCVTVLKRTGIDVPEGCCTRDHSQNDDGKGGANGGSVVRPPSWLVNQFDLGDDTDVSKAEDKGGKKKENDDEITLGSDASGLLGNLAMGGDAGEKNERRKIACLRKSRITPIGQIHALKPSAQPKAWLDIMASGLTSTDEKNEAMEEILILVKDKTHAQIFLDEGILDSLMYILSTSFQKLPPPAPEAPNSVFNQNLIPHNNKTFIHAKLAANCSVALGKAHCAVVHTEGDLLLMSAYNRGLVPVERQLAQMLHEVPHHSRMLGTGVGEILEDGMQEEFILTEMTMQQAEEMAKNIKALMEGRLEWNSQTNLIDS